MLELYHVRVTDTFTYNKDIEYYQTLHNKLLYQPLYIQYHNNGYIILR